jgi:hypothetical protein
LLPELQFLGNDHRREPDVGILKTLVETIYVLLGKGGKEVRMGIKEAGAYLVVRELHLEIEDEGLRAVCERVVDVLMIDDDDGGMSMPSKASGGEEVDAMAEGVRPVADEDLNTADPKKSITQTEDPNKRPSQITLSDEKEDTHLTRSTPASASTAHLTNNINHEDDDENEDEDEDDNRIIEIF